MHVSCPSACGIERVPLDSMSHQFKSDSDTAAHLRISHVAKYLLTISLTTARISGMPYVTMAPQLE
jgi:hypothetical protein